MSARVGLSEEQLDIVDMCTSFAYREMLPQMQEWDEKEEFPVDTLRQLAGLGLGAIYASTVREFMQCVSCFFIR